MVETDRSRILVAGGLAVLTLFASAGCGRRARSSLQPRVDISQLVDGDTESSEQLANEKIDAERRKAESALTESDTLLASAEEDRSWKDRLLPKKSKLPTADDFGNDPFLDGLDGMIAEETAHLDKAARNTVEKITEMEAAELFGDFEQKKSQTLANIDKAASETVANAADVFGDAVEDVFGADPAPAATPVPNEFAEVSRPAQISRAGVQEPQGSVVHRFDDLFSESADARQVAGPEEQGVAVAPEAFVPNEPHQLHVEPVRTDLPEIHEASVAGMFDPPDMPAVERPPTLPEIVVPEEAPVALVDLTQQDAVVTPNSPAALPAAIPEPTGPGRFSDGDFAAMERMEVDPYLEPSFSAPTTRELPPVPSFPPVEIPAEPAPRFAQADTRTHVPATSQVVQTNATQAPAIAAATQPSAVLPDVNWQSQAVTPRKLRAPSEWTAWFLMGGAALIVMLLFAPGRRE